MTGTTIPQATLHSIRQLVDASEEGAGTPSELGTRLDLSPRHVAYAIEAAAVLGLIVQKHGTVRPTEIGRELSRTEPGSESERQLFKDAVSSSPQMQQIAPGLLDEVVPSKEELIARFAALGDLSMSTAKHRASMVLKWRHQLVSPQIRLFAGKAQGMWRRIEITNFRSIAHADVLLAPFTVVVGQNGVGKSNFADTLVFARDVAFDASSAISSRGGIAGIRRWRPSKPTDVGIDIRAADSRSHLAESYVRHYFKIHSGSKGEWSFSQETIEITETGQRKAYVERGRRNKIESSRGSIVAVTGTTSAMVDARQMRQFVRTSALTNVRRYRLNPEAMRQPQFANEQTRLKENGENITTAIREIRRSGQVKAIVEPMARIVPGLQDINVEQIGRYLALKFHQLQEKSAIADFNATEMSEGALRSLGIIVATHQMERDELLVIEEPEVSIHVGAANLLFEILKAASQRGAVLLTTHSADLLEAAQDEEILVCEYVDGSTRIGPLSKAQRKILREGLFSIAELMRSEPLRIETTANGERSSSPMRPHYGKAR